MMKQNKVLLTLSIILAVISLINLIFLTVLSYSTPFLFIANLLLGCICLIRSKKLAIISFTAALSQAFFIPSFVSLNFLHTPYQSENSLKVATYNVQGFTCNKVVTTEQVLSILEREGVDVVCFQEYIETSDQFESSSAIISKSFPYYCIQNQDSPRSTGLALFSRYPIIESAEELFSFGINSGMYSDIDYNGKLVRIINCHLMTTGVNQTRHYGSEAMLTQALKNMSIRNQQARFISYLISSTKSPIVLCGDFNDPPISASYRIINRKLRDGFKPSGKGYASTYTGQFKNLLRIDYIFNSKELKCTMYNNTHYIFSDHKPVISTLELKN